MKNLNNNEIKIIAGGAGSCERELGKYENLRAISEYGPIALIIAGFSLPTTALPALLVLGIPAITTAKLLKQSSADVVGNTCSPTEIKDYYEAIDISWYGESY